mmetsp:Transcript_94427/g.270409  ORF Transcript_94427/g.270409 Transcript_94427/m.270409 type:complete len:209 (-) Transcript_94427:212-838(-)
MSTTISTATAQRAAAHGTQNARPNTHAGLITAHVCAIARNTRFLRCGLPQRWPGPRRIFHKDQHEPRFLLPLHLRRRNSPTQLRDMQIEPTERVVPDRQCEAARRVREVDQRRVQHTDVGDLHIYFDPRRAVGKAVFGQGLPSELGLRRRRYGDLCRVDFLRSVHLILLRLDPIVGAVVRPVVAILLAGFNFPARPLPPRGASRCVVN